MNHDKLTMIADRSAKNLRALISEMNDDISEAIAAAAEQAEHDGKETFTVTLSHSIKLDLVANKQEDTLSVNVRHKGSIEGTLPDPSQPDLPFEADEN